MFIDMQIRPGGLKDTGAITAAGLRINTRIAPERLLIAEDSEGTVLGYAYHFRSQMHPSRYWCTVRVREDARRRGIATQLVSALAAERAEQLPFYVRLPEGSGGLAWTAELGGHIFQENPPMALNLRSPDNRVWFGTLPDYDTPASASGAAGNISVVSGNDLDDETILQAFLATYEWVHAAWSPPSSMGYIASVFGPGLREDLERNVSSFAVRDFGSPDQEVVAGIWAFADSDAELSAAGESTKREIPGAADHLAACLRRAAHTAVTKGYKTLTFDGYVSDPHLAPLLAAAPDVTGTRMIWMEYCVPAERALTDARLENSR